MNKVDDYSGVCVGVDLDFDFDFDFASLLIPLDISYCLYSLHTNTSIRVTLHILPLLHPMSINNSFKLLGCVGENIKKRNRPPTSLAIVPFSMGQMQSSMQVPVKTEKNRKERGRVPDAAEHAKGAGVKLRKGRYMQQGFCFWVFLLGGVSWIFCNLGFRLSD